LQGFQIGALGFDFRKPAFQLRAAVFHLSSRRFDLRAPGFQLRPICLDLGAVALDVLELTCALGPQLLGDAASLGLGMSAVGGQLLLLLGELGDPRFELLAERGDVLELGLVLLAGQRERLLVVVQLGFDPVHLGPLAVERFAELVELLPFSLEAVEVVIEFLALAGDLVELLLELPGLAGVEVG